MMDLDNILHNHVDSDILQTEIESLEKKLSDNYTCKICGKKVKGASNHLRHETSHSKTHQCTRCLRHFNRTDSLKRHLRSCKGDNGVNVVKKGAVKTHSCSVCGKVFKTVANLREHERNHFANNNATGETRQQCSVCNTTCQSYLSLFEHLRSTHGIRSDNNGEANQVGGNIELAKSALGGAAKEFHIRPVNDGEYDLLAFMMNNRMGVEKILTEQCQKKKHIKWYLNLHVQLVRSISDAKHRDVVEAHFRSAVSYLLRPESLGEHDLNGAYQKMFKSFDEYLGRGSGWTLDKILKLDVHVQVYRPLGGSSYMKLPRCLSKNAAIVNVRNKDSKCFLWSVLACLHPIKKNSERVTHYTKFEKELNMSGMEYPVTLDQIAMFERLNNISVNVLGYENGDIFPLRISTLKTSDRHVDLFLLQDEERVHYCCIKNLDRLLRRTRHRSRSYTFCRYCLQGFTSKRVLDKHIVYCSTHKAQYTEFPTEGEDDVLEFNEFHKQMYCPFVIYCDFETLCCQMDSCSPNPAHSSTTNRAHFQACGYGYKVVCTDTRYSKSPVIYRGPNASRHFLNAIIQEEKNIKRILKHTKPIRMTPGDELHFLNARECHICGAEMTSSTGKVRDHCHVSGKFRGAACSSCNLNFRHPKYIPVVFHNLRNFDAHILCEAIGLFKNRRITCIPQNMERYISFTLGDLRFIDSFQFLSSSLSTLVNDLALDNPNHFTFMREEYGHTRQFDLLLRKGVYPYEWMTSFEQFNEVRLPSKSAFYSSLSKTDMSDEDYQHAQEVWNSFNIRTMGEYHDLYLKTDVLQLASVFEQFRVACMQNYKLDPAHYYTSPGLSWSAALRYTGVSLSLITDPDAHLFWERGVRGGVSQISKRFAKANNTYIPEAFDPMQESSYLVYKDCTNLYGYAMTQYLPTGDNMIFLDEKRCKNFDVMQVPDNGKKGYVLSVDLEYPRMLHDEHSDYPLAPEVMTPPDEMLSPYSHRLWKSMNPKGKHLNGQLDGRVKTPKLICSLYDRKDYVLHYRTLKLYLSLGMRLKKINRILEFDQSPWLKPYIDFNSLKRKEAKSEFQRNFFKLMNNSVFGKTMENIRKRVDVQLIHQRKRLSKRVSMVSFQRCQIFNKHLVGVEHKKVKLKMNKPIYVGMSVLEIAKGVMYDFHYNHMKRMYGDRLHLLMTDTDSLFYEVMCEDIYLDMMVNKHLYDLSNFPGNHFLHDVTNKKKPGTFKSETADIPITEFAGLRSKMYSFRVREPVNNTLEKQIAKGIAKSTIKSDLRHEHYRSCVLDQRIMRCEMDLIRSQNHQLFLTRINKIALSAMDDKRWIQDNGIDTYAFGHYRINSIL